MHEEANIVISKIVGPITNYHDLLLKVTEDLTDEQFSQQPSPFAPPIGWHLWHITRWADRIHTKLDENNTELWTQNKLVTAWGLQPARLGRLETGIEMAIADAVTVAGVGSNAHLNYSRQVFDSFHAAMSAFDDDELLETHLSVFGDQKMTLIDTLIFHLRHTGRHLGMIEALRGALFAMSGSATN